MANDERLRQAAQLDRAGISYARLLQRGGLSDLAPRPAHVRRLAGLLRQGASVLLVGRPGTGRRCLVQLAVRELLADPLDADLGSAILALLCDEAEDGSPSSPGPTPRDVVEVSVASFMVEAIYVGELETKFAALVQNARKANVALFVPDLHLACGAGASVQNPERTVAALVAAPLRQRELQLVASTTPQGLQALRALQPELLGLLVPLEVPEADDAEAEQMLGAVGHGHGDGVSLSPVAARAAVRVSRRSHAGEALPGRAFALVRETAARLRSDGASYGAALTELDLRETYRLRAGLRSEVLDQQCALHRQGLEAHFAARVVGQPEAVAAVARLVLAFKAGLVADDRPIGTFLFAGPTGVGKTHLAQCLAEYLFGSRARLIRFDMGEYADVDAVDRFVGGHAHARESGLLAKVRGTPFAVLLLDEIEKAHPRVLGSLLSLLDAGTLTDGRGDSVSGQNTVVILTTNVGAELYHRTPITLAPGASAQPTSSVRRALESAFSPEFLNRMSEVVVFRSLDEAALRAVAERELDRVAGLARDRGLRLEIAASVAPCLAAASAKSAYGAREIQRAARRQVIGAIAEAVASRPCRSLSIEVVDGVVVASETPPRLLSAARRAARRRTSAPERARERAAADHLRLLRRQLACKPARHEHVREAALDLLELGGAARGRGRPDLERKFLREALAQWMRLTPGSDCPPPQVALEIASSHLALCLLARDRGEETHHLVAAVRFLGRARAGSRRAQRLWSLTREAFARVAHHGGAQ